MLLARRMATKSFRRGRDPLGVQRGKCAAVEITRGVRAELLIVINGQPASLTHTETLAALKATGRPIVQQLCEILETGSTEARADSAWLLGQIEAKAAIPWLTGTLDGARWSGEAPVVLRRTTEALLCLGPAGVRAFDRAIRPLSPNDFTRLLLIRRASEQLVNTSRPYPVSRQITSGWIQALDVYLRGLERRVSEANKLSFQRIVLEAYGLTLEWERERVFELIQALRRYPARAARKASAAFASR